MVGVDVGTVILNGPFLFVFCIVYIFLGSFMGMIVRNFLL